MQLVKNDILGVRVTNASKEEVLEFCFEKIKNFTGKYYITTPNPEIIIHATRHNAFKTIINNASVALCDGVGITWAGTILGKSFTERFTGVDFVESFCEKSSKKLVTVGFLGGKPGIALKAAECLRKKYSGLRVVLAEAGNPDEKTVSLVNERIRAYFSDGNNAIGLGSERQRDKDTKIQSKEGAKKERAIMETKEGMMQYDADIQPQTEKTTVEDGLDSRLRGNDIKGRASDQLDMLFVAFGFPKQEMWIAEHLDKLDVKAAMGVGGTFDYLSGEVTRAPHIIRAVGLEWLYRLIRQPWRWKRQLALVQFMLLVYKVRMQQRH